ncbi:hypothetical protein [Microcoleus sp. FACHB-672]|uniref:hypothetical protein n=1 Tax=Microcoleus sp. FACHB-672 TaxID=2692825 RepID=UPI0016849EE7|nr:hypothetical protein [Microcoleus sp. FACHB-672]MBD2042937.1 hypothetical protein [Microcoleus sp. FACHB-672]
MQSPRKYPAGWLGRATITEEVRAEIKAESQGKINSLTQQLEWMTAKYDTVNYQFEEMTAKYEAVLARLEVIERGR